MRNRGEKGLNSNDSNNVFFKLDAKLVLLYDDAEYPVSCLEFAKKIKTDRSKLLVEAKTIRNHIIGLGIDEDDELDLNITNVQITGKTVIYSFFF